MVGILATVFLCVPLQAALQIVTEQEYTAAMRETNFIVGDAGLHIDARYWPELSDDLGKLRSQFERVEAFWSARDADEALALAREVIDGIEPLAADADQDQQAAMGRSESFAASASSATASFGKRTLTEAVGSNPDQRSAATHTARACWVSADKHDHPPDSSPQFAGQRTPWLSVPCASGGIGPVPV